MSNQTTDATFKKDVIESKETVLVDFWAQWCGPCRMLGPVIDKIETQVTGKAKVFKLNVDENPITSNNFSITGIPTVIVFKNGKVAQQFVGVQPEKVYLDALSS